MASLVNGIPFPADSFDSIGEVPLVRIRDLSSAEFDTFVPKSIVPSEAIIRNGDVLVGMDGDFNVLRWNRGMAALNQRVCLLRANNEFDSRFLAYSLPPHLKKINDLTYSTTVKHLSSRQVRGIRISAPALSEQEVISDYLDRETQKIDELITEQCGLIETLRERRQAVIDAEFEELPVSRIALRRHIEFLTSGSRGWGEYYADSGDTFVRIGNLPRGGLELGGERKFVALPPEAHEGKRTILKNRDLLFSITAYIGSVAVVNGEWEGAYVSQHVALCRLDKEVLNSKFIGYFALSNEGNHQLSEGAVGGAKVQLTLDDIKSLRVPNVPLDLQGRIVDYLDKQTARIDDLISESEDLIALSEERRAALITAAVTGQSDVRATA